MTVRIFTPSRAERSTRTCTRAAVAGLVAAAVIAASTAPAAGQVQWTLEPEPCSESSRSRVGAGPIVPVTVDADGRLYAGYPLEYMVRAFARSGAVERTFGEDVELPDVSRLAIRGDSLLVIDRRYGSVSVFQLDGRFVRRFDLRPPNGWHDDVVPRILAVLSDGSRLMVPVLRPITDPKVLDGQWRMPIVRMVDNGRADTIASTAPYLHRIPVTVGGRNSLTPSQLERGPHIAASGPARRIAIAEGPSTTGDDEHRFRVTVLRPDGDTVFSRMYDYTPTPVPMGTVDSLVHVYGDRLARIAARGRATQRERAAARDSVRAAYDVGRWLPPVTGARVARDGDVWIRRERLGQDSVEWLVVAPDDGTARATLALSPTARPYPSTDGYVWLVDSAESVQCRVRRYRVVASG